jgi:hypothetical protein
MKIISNFKDYYDYLQGVYGMDEKIIYNRRTREIQETWQKKTSSYAITSNEEVAGVYRPKHIRDNIPQQVYRYDLSVCGIRYEIFTYMGKYYGGIEAVSELLEILTPLKDTIIEVEYPQYAQMNINRFLRDKLNVEMVDSYLYFADSEFYTYSSQYKHLQETDDNEKYGEPVILYAEKHDKYSSGNDILTNVRLSDFGMGSFLPADEAFLKIGTFLSREKPVTDNRDDIAKLESYGFDKKTSFRKM